MPSITTQTPYGPVTTVTDGYLAIDTQCRMCLLQVGDKTTVRVEAAAAPGLSLVPMRDQNGLPLLYTAPGVYVLPARARVVALSVLGEASLAEIA